MSPRPSSRVRISPPAGESKALLYSSSVTTPSPFPPILSMDLNSRYMILSLTVSPEISESSILPFWFLSNSLSIWLKGGGSTPVGSERIDGVAGPMFTIRKHCKNRHPSEEAEQNRQ